MIPLCIPLAALSSDLASLSALEISQIDSGRVVVHMERGNQPVHRFMVAGTVDAPVDAVWAAYTDFDDYAKIFGITSSRVRRREGDTLWAWFSVDLNWPLEPRWTLNETHLYPDRHYMTYRRVEGSFRRYDGDLALLAAGPDRTRVYYAAAIDPGYRFIPGWMLDWVQDRMLGTAITDVRSWLAGPGKSLLQPRAIRYERP